MSEQEVRVGGIPLCRHNQTGFCKFGDQCFKDHINEICKEKLCKNNNCTKRHPRVCKYFASNNRCKFEESCAYIHHKRENMEQIDLLEREVNYLKSEIIKLTKQTEEMVQKVKENYLQNNDINEMKEEIIQIKDTMSKITNNFLNVQMNEHEQESNGETNFLCVKCDSTFKSEMTLNKHVNTKHPEKVSHLEKTECKNYQKKYFSQNYTFH